MVELVNFLLQIFTEEVGDVRNFPRLEVFEHIKECAPAKAIDYLV